MTPCNRVEVYRRFDGTYPLHVQGKKTEENVGALIREIYYIYIYMGAWGSVVVKALRY